jgi:hypothetical protein
MSEQLVTDTAKLAKWVTQQKAFNYVVIVAFFSLSVLVFWFQYQSSNQLLRVHSGVTTDLLTVQHELRALRAQIGKARDLDELRSWMADPDSVADMRGAESPK